MNLSFLTYFMGMALSAPLFAATASSVDPNEPISSLALNFSKTLNGRGEGHFQVGFYVHALTPFKPYLRLCFGGWHFEIAIRRLPLKNKRPSLHQSFLSCSISNQCHRQQAGITLIEMDELPLREIQGGEDFSKEVEGDAAERYEKIFQLYKERLIEEDPSFFKLPPEWIKIFMNATLTGQPPMVQALMETQFEDEKEEDKKILRGYLKKISRFAFCFDVDAKMEILTRFTRSALKYIRFHWLEASKNERLWPEDWIQAILLSRSTPPVSPEGHKILALFGLVYREEVIRFFQAKRDAQPSSRSLEMCEFSLVRLWTLASMPAFRDGKSFENFFKSNAFQTQLRNHGSSIKPAINRIFSQEYLGKSPSSLAYLLSHPLSKIIEEISCASHDLHRALQAKVSKRVKCDLLQKLKNDLCQAIEKIS